MIIKKNVVVFKELVKFFLNILAKYILVCTYKIKEKKKVQNLLFKSKLNFSNCFETAVGFRTNLF